MTIDYTVPPTDVPESDGISVVDGHIALHGSHEQLAGIEATSQEGHLALATTSLTIPDLMVGVELHQPFGAGAVTVANTPHSVVIGVLGRENRVDIEGTTLTSILYQGPAADFHDDVTVNLALGDTLSTPPVPEPTTAVLLFIGLASGSCYRRGRGNRDSGRK